MRVDPPRFIADAMLGKLAGWLRLIGYDTVYECDIADAALAERAVAERRIVLTRDRMLPQQHELSDYLRLDSDRPLEQLREVAAAYRLDWRSGLFSRCRRCNGQLRPIRREAAAAAVPPRVLLEQKRFARCVECGRTYWHGSHARRMQQTLERILG